MEHGLEERAVRAICGLDNLVFWHRTPSQIDFHINGAINHFPDCSARVAWCCWRLKGGGRDNSDLAAKLQLGRTWASEAGAHYHYSMVFEKLGIQGVLRLDELAANFRFVAIKEWLDHNSGTNVQCDRLRWDIANITLAKLNTTFSIRNKAGTTCLAQFC